LKTYNFKKFWKEEAERIKIIYFLFSFFISMSLLLEIERVSKKERERTRSKGCMIVKQEEGMKRKDHASFCSEIDSLSLPPKKEQAMEIARVQALKSNQEREGENFLSFPSPFFIFCCFSFLSPFC
jgi:hypothetical protein